MANVCVIDDQPLMRESLQQALHAAEHRVTVFDNAQEALALIKSAPAQQPDVILTDLRLPGMDGVALLREMRRLGLDIPVVLMTAYASVSTAVEAMKLGAFDYVQKPFNGEEIAIVIERAVRERNLVRDNEVLQRTIEDIRRDRRLVAAGPAMTAVIEKCRRLGQSSATVLVTGESGTGKEMVARAIHAASPRAARPLMCVNCAALSRTLLESELFGHEKGAFTGADRLRKGRFELADGGTVLLDEISEMELELQAKLLRVLQEHEFERVGSSVTRRVDTRVIATTNRDLREWVALGKFREDLYYRLSVLLVHVPPLRERREDIEPLIEYFIGSICSRDGREPPRLTPEALRMLSEHAWPGNVRELENLCERLCVLESGRTVRPETLAGLIAAPIKSASAPLADMDLRHGRILADAERALTMRTLAQFNGHREKTARALGIGLRTLGLKLKRWREESALETGSATRDVGRPTPV